MGIVDVIELKKYFPVKRKFLTPRTYLKAVDGVSFSLEDGSVFALVGESGSGKSTIARLILRLLHPTGGSILFRGKDIQTFGGTLLREFRKSVQIIFQDPFASLNPRMNVFDTVSEPLTIHRLCGKAEMKDKVVELLRSVGLQPDVLYHYPHEFSGGQRQRICIARALAVSPRVLVADEPLSALDVSIQAQILNILQELQAKDRISFLFISHDLRVVQYFSEEVAVLYLGKIVEKARTDDLFGNPFHPYTEELLASAPKLKPEGRTRRTVKGEVPSPIDIPSGCPFHPRCPKRHDPCDTVVPRLHERSGRLVACHLFS